MRKGDAFVFQIGELVVYGIHGVCRILTTETRVIDRKKVEYFVLSPIEQPETRYYIPTQNSAALSKLRRLIEKSAIDDILCKGFDCSNLWIADEGKRKLHYRELINRADVAELLPIIHALHLHREEQALQGRKFHLCDENFLRDAEKLILSEFSVALNITREQVKTYINDHLNA